MSDRFDDMFVQGVNTSDATATTSDILQGKTAYVAGGKVTGTLVPSGGSVDFNVYIQNTEPEDKDGVWIKQAGSGRAPATLAAYYTATGNFLPPNNVANLNPNGDYLGQVIVGDYLFHFGGTPEKSYKYDLRTHTSEPIDIPTTSFSHGYGAYYDQEEGEIVVVYLIGGNITSYRYNIENDSCTPTFSIGYSHTTDDRGYGVVFYDGGYYHYLHVVYRGTSLGSQLRYDRVWWAYYGAIPERENVYFSSIQETIRCAYCSKFGDIILATYANVWKIDYINMELFKFASDGLTDVYSLTIDASNRTHRAIYVSGDYFYIFFNEANYYLRGQLHYGDVSTAQYHPFVEVDTNIPYVISSDEYSLQKTTFDEVRGQLYLRSKDTSTYVYQFYESVNPETLPAGDVVVIQDVAYNNPTKIIDDPRVQIGVSDTYVKTLNGLDGYHLSFWGDGVQWNVIKNQPQETCTMYFDSDGGSQVASKQVIIGRIPTPPAEPSKLNCVFNGWYVGNKEYKFNTPLTKDITLTAHWLTYVQVTYIESDGNQYIDTGIVPNITTAVEVEYIPMGTAVGYLFGSYKSGAYYYYSHFPDTARVGFGNKTQNTIAITPDSTYTLELANKVFTLNNTQIYDASSATFGTTDYTIMLFADNSGTIRDFGKYKMYSFKIYDNGTLVRDFIPIKIVETNEFCLRDEVEGVVYHNLGTGEFIGDGYEPTYVTYVENNSNARIDTGITPNQDTKVIIDFEILTSSNTTKGLFGVRASATSNNYSVIADGNNSPFPLYTGYNNVNTNTGESLTAGVRYEIIKDKEKTYLDGTLIDTATVATFTCPYPMDLFAARQGSSRYSAHMKLYSFKVYDNGTLVRDFAPAVDYYGVACLWDKVWKKFYYNTVSGGSFTPRK